MWPFSRKTALLIPTVKTVPSAIVSPSTGADRLTFTSLAATFIDLPSDGHVAVHGESHYQQALALVVEGRIAGDTLDEHIVAEAALIPEPDNPWDPNAVRVGAFVKGRTVTVGYLPREKASEYQPNLMVLRSKGIIGRCGARVAGGGIKMYGIYLDLCYPENLRVVTGRENPQIPTENDGSVMLAAEWTCTVTKEMPHQAALFPYSPDSSTDIREVIAELGVCVATTGKYRGSPAVEVRLGGQRVGELTHLMSERYLGIVNQILDLGLKPMCEAAVVATPNGLEVELMMPNATNQLHIIRV